MQLLQLRVFNTILARRKRIQLTCLNFKQRAGLLTTKIAYRSQQVITRRKAMLIFTFRHQVVPTRN